MSIKYSTWLIVLGLVLSCELAARPKLKRLPQPTEQGVTGAVAVQTDTMVYVAGGLDPVAGSFKSRVLKWNGHRWSVAGALREPLAHGVAVAVPGGFIYAGGTNAKGSSRAVDLYQFFDEGLPVVEALPDLPVGLERMAGALIDQRLYLVGGITDGKAVNTVYLLKLDDTDAGWQRMVDFPGPPRAEAVMAVARQQGKQCLFLWGGYAPGYKDVEPVVSVDGLRFDPVTAEWSSVLPPVDKKGNIISLGAGAAVALDDTRIAISGGFNADVKRKELRRTSFFKGVERWSLLSHYFSKPIEWYGFNQKMLIYDAARNRWKFVAEHEALARTGAAAVLFGTGILLFQGEVKPGTAVGDVIHLTLPE